MTDVFVDAEGALKAALAGKPALVGFGNPLTNGAHIGQVSSAANATWAELTRVGGGTDTSGYLDAPRMSASVYGPTRVAANAAAVALANVLARLDAAPVTTPAGVVNNASSISILWSPDGARPRYLVECVLTVSPVV